MNDVILKAWGEYGLKDFSLVDEHGWLKYDEMFSLWYSDAVPYLKENNMPFEREAYEFDVIAPATGSWYSGMRPISLKYSNL